MIMQNSKEINFSVYNKTIQLLIKLVELYPVYGSENQKKAQDVLGHYLSLNGWKIYQDEFKIGEIENRNFLRKPWEYDLYYQQNQEIFRSNLYGILDSGKPGKTVILNGHIDVDIKDKENLGNDRGCSINEDKIYGRGTADMLSGLCCLASVSQLLKTNQWSGKVIFMSVVDEEIGGNGSLRGVEWLLKKEKIHITECEVIIAEPTNNIMLRESMGFLPFSITLKNNVQHMNTVGGKLEHKIVELVECFEKIKEIDRNFQYNIGIIEGGLDASLPINKLTLKGICATTVKANNEFVKKQIVKKLKNARINFPKMEIEPVAAKEIKTAIQQNSNESQLFMSACDISVFNHFGFNTVIFGPGNLEQAHSPKEFVSLKNLKKYLQLLSKYLNKVLEVKSNGYKIYESK